VTCNNDEKVCDNPPCFSRLEDDQIIEVPFLPVIFDGGEQVLSCLLSVSRVFHPWLAYLWYPRWVTTRQAADR
jgi:hypothetical protein